MTNWFYFDGEKKQCGPVSADIIKQLVRQGILAPNAPLIGEDGKTSTTADKIDAQKPSCIGCGCLILLFIFIFFALRPACRTTSETPNIDIPAIVKRGPPKEYVLEKSGADLMDWQIEVRIGWELDNNRIREIADSVTSKYLQQSFLATVTFRYDSDVFAVVKYQKGKFSEADFVFDRKRAEEQKRREEEAARRLTANEQKNASPTPAAKVDKAVPLPSYSVISDDSLGTIKRSVDIRLDDRITEKQIAALAERIKKQGRKKYDRTFICYYLPGMTVGSGAWATSHFDPDLKIRILGATKEFSESAQKASEESDEEIIGRWGFVMQSVIAFKKKDGADLVEIKFPDGSGKECPLFVETKLGQTIYRTEPPFPTGKSTFRISPSGELISFDEEGEIARYSKIK